MNSWLYLPYNWIELEELYILFNIFLLVVSLHIIFQVDQVMVVVVV